MLRSQADSLKATLDQIRKPMTEPDGFSSTRIKTAQLWDANQASVQLECCPGAFFSGTDLIFMYVKIRIQLFAHSEQMP